MIFNDKLTLSTPLNISVTNMVEEEKGDLLADTHNILNREKK
jgi:hypothetical protein